MLLDDGLSAEQQADVVGHLDECAACQKRLETLAADPVWWEQLRHLPSKEKRHTAAFPLHEEVKTCTPRSDRAAEDSPDDGIWLDFLDPSDDPEHLGRLGRL